MVKKFNTEANPILNSVIDNIEISLKCSKYNQMADRIVVCLPDDVKFEKAENKELAAKGFGTCLVRDYYIGMWEVIVIVNMKNCTKASLTEQEIAAVIFHELGHILNEPELRDEPTVEYCLMHGLQFDREVLRVVQESKCMEKEIFADSYANMHGYGDALISTFHKQDQNFEQKIGYRAGRIEKIMNREYFEGKIVSTKRGRYSMCGPLPGSE